MTEIGGVHSDYEDEYENIVYGDPPNWWSTPEDNNRSNGAPG
jgi:hypothetical protein